MNSSLSWPAHDAKCELANWDIAETHRSQSGPGGGVWDAHDPSVHPDGPKRDVEGFPDSCQAVPGDPGRCCNRSLGTSLNIRAGYSSSNTSLNPIGQSPPRWTSNVSMKILGCAGICRLGRPERGTLFEGDPRLIIHRDVVYGRTQPDIQKLDAYSVKFTQPTPVVVEIHGGGWRRGSKSQFVYAGNLIGAILDAGISVVSIDYRLTPKHTFPAQMDDVVRAVQFVRSRAREWNLVPEGSARWAVRLAALGSVGSTAR